MIIVIVIIVILIIVIVILILIIILIIISDNGMILGTIIGEDKSFGRQETEDTGGLPPSTPPSWCCIFTTYYLYMGGLSLIVIAIGTGC